MSRIEVIVCAKSELERTTALVAATHVISLLDPEDTIERPASIPGDRHLRLTFDDTENPSDAAAPTRGHVDTILRFGRELPDNAIAVIHCRGGICRSTAAAFAILAQEHGVTRQGIARAMKELLEFRPQALPNLLIAKLADDILGAGGRLLRRAEAQYRRRMREILT